MSWAQRTETQRRWSWSGNWLIHGSFMALFVRKCSGLLAHSVGVPQGCIRDASACSHGPQVMVKSSCIHWLMSFLAKKSFGPASNLMSFLVKKKNSFGPVARVAPIGIILFILFILLWQRASFNNPLYWPNQWIQGTYVRRRDFKRRIRVSQRSQKGEKSHDLDKEICSINLMEHILL